ncbi:unnamed protein product [Victoria cruziana]
MAMDLLLKSPSLLEEKSNPETMKEVEEMVKDEEGLIMDRESLNFSSPNKDYAKGNLVEQLESAKAEMGEVKGENERLKIILSRIMKDYQALQMHFFEIVQQEESSKKSPEATAVTTSSDHKTEETELVSLSLGSFSAEAYKTEKSNSSKKGGDRDHSPKSTGLSLGLGCKFEVSSDNSTEELKELRDVGEGWPPTGLVKPSRGAEEDVSQPAHIKKARVSVRARCDAPTMQDGCQWRKYGQKIAKGNPCPRAYYRCTVAPACPVRKQVQRCAEDMSILITTYEGTHNHPLPLQATAMASTTSAAASMLMSGSAAHSDTGTSASAGLTFNLFDNSRTRPFYLSTPAVSSSSPSYPTITLDLTSTSSAPQFSKLPSSFSSTTRYFNYGSSHRYSKSTPVVSSVLSRSPHEQQFYPNYLQKPNRSATVVPPVAVAAPSSSSQQNLSDTIAAATKAITSDPSFQSALAAAITSIVGSGAPPPGQSGKDNEVQTLKWGGKFSSSIINSPSYSSGGAGGAGCEPAFLNRTSSNGASGSGQKGSSLLIPPPPSISFSSAKSPSASPAADLNREHNC